MIEGLAYAIGAALGIAIPIGPTRWAALFIASAAFDDVRFHGISPANVILVAFLVSLGVDYFAGGRLRSSPLLLPLLGVLLTAAVSTALSNDPLGRVPFLISLTAMTMSTFGLCTVASNHRRVERLMSAVLWMSGLLAVAVIVESSLWVFFGIVLKNNVYALRNLNLNILQATGLFSANGLAAFHLIPGTALAAGLRSRLTDRQARRRLGWYLLLTVTAMLATVARAALVTLVLLILILLIRRASRGGWMRGVAVIALVAVVAAVPPFLRVTAAFNIDSYIARYAIVLGAAASVRQHPLFGTGPGSRVVARYPASLRAIAPDLEYNDVSARDTHNTLLQIPVDLGLLGFAWFMTLNAGLFGAGLLRLHRMTDARAATMLQSLLIALLVTEFFSLFDSGLYTKPIWLLFGLTAAATSMAGAQRNSKATEVRQVSLLSRYGQHASTAH